VRAINFMKGGQFHWMHANLVLFALGHEAKTNRDITVAIPAQFTSFCDVRSELVCLTLRLAIPYPYVPINGLDSYLRTDSPVAVARIPDPAQQILG